MFVLPAEPREMKTLGNAGHSLGSRFHSLSIVGLIVYISASFLLVFFVGCFYLFCFKFKMTCVELNHR